MRPPHHRSAMGESTPCGGLVNRKTRPIWSGRAALALPALRRRAFNGHAPLWRRASRLRGRASLSFLAAILAVFALRAVALCFAQVVQILMTPHPGKSKSDGRHSRESDPPRTRGNLRASWIWWVASKAYSTFTAQRPPPFHGCSAAGLAAGDAKTTAARGGRVTARECGKPWLSSAKVFTSPRLPTPLPP